MRLTVDDIKIGDKVKLLKCTSFISEWNNNADKYFEVVDKTNRLIYISGKKVGVPDKQFTARTIGYKWSLSASHLPQIELKSQKQLVFNFMEQE